jgi:LPXTG-motif cell wall-anchored protein
LAPIVKERLALKKLLLLGVTIAIVSLMLSAPVIAQDRSSDTSFEFAGKAEYNRPSGGAEKSGSGSGSSKSGSSEAGSSKSGSPKTLPETGGVPLLALGGVVLLASCGLLVRYGVRR